MSAPRQENWPTNVNGTTAYSSRNSQAEEALQRLEELVLPYALRDQHEDVIRLLQDESPATLAESSTLGYWLALALLSSSRINEGIHIVQLLEQQHPNPDTLTSGRILIVRAIGCIYDGAIDDALDFVRAATRILPDAAVQERFRAWATIQTLSIHFGNFSMGECASARLRELREELPTDQHWWYSFVVPNQADWLVKTGRLDEAEKFLQEHLPTSTVAAKPVIHLRLAVIALEKRALECAEAHIGALPNPIPDAYWKLEAELTRVEYLQAKGDTEAAITGLYSIIRERTALGSDVEIYRPQLVLAEIWIDQGQVDLAQIWLHLASKPIDEWPRSFGHPVPDMTTVRLAIANEAWDDAEIRLQQLYETGRLRNHSGLLVRICSHLAYVHAQQGKDQEAVTMAKNAIQAGIHGNFLDSYIVNRIDVREFIDSEPKLVVQRANQASTSAHLLSTRELEIIHLLNIGTTNQEIADQLFISRNTVKNHLQNIYRKLKATNRREAIEVSRWMGLLQSRPFGSSKHSK